MEIQNIQNKKMQLTDYILHTEKDPEMWRYYKMQEASDWTAEEFSFHKEREDYINSPPRIKKLLKGIFAFFLIGDGLISENILKFILRAIFKKNWPEVYFLSMQLKVENTHAETYSKAALTIIPHEEHQSMFNMCKDLECVKEKGQWIKLHIDEQKSEGLENLACAVSEGVFFVSLFAVIFYFRKLNIFKNFIESNEQIAKDETLHRNQKCAMALRTLKDSEKEQAIEIIKKGVEIEKKHSDYLLQDSISSIQEDRDSGLYKENIYLYIEMLADQVCYLSGLELIYGSHVELSWMADINMSQKTNFYERDVVASYRKFDPEEAIKITDDTDETGENNFSLNEDF